MGGYKSGNHGGRPTVEASLPLRLSKLLCEGLVRPNCRLSGPLTWNDSLTGQQTAAVAYEAHLAETHGRLRLLYTSTDFWTGERRCQDYWISLEATPQPFGGQRWWFICPKRHERVATLYLPAGAHTFASRKAYRLGYRSQRESSQDRALSRAFKLRHRLGDDGGIGMGIIKPKGMHHATFERALARLEAAEHIVDAHTVALVRRLAEMA